MKSKAFILMQIEELLKSTGSGTWVQIFSKWSSQIRTAKSWYDSVPTNSLTVMNIEHEPEDPDDITSNLVF